MTPLPKIIITLETEEHDHDDTLYVEGTGTAHVEGDISRTVDISVEGDDRSGLETDDAVAAIIELIGANSVDTEEMRDKVDDAVREAMGNVVAFDPNTGAIEMRA